MFITIQGTLAADVATNGTFVVSYPTPWSGGSFDNGGPHELYVNGSPYKSPAGFTVAFSGTSATITYLGATTLKAGQRFTVGFRKLGIDGNRPFDAIKGNLKAVLSPDWLIHLGSPAAASSNGLATSQSVGLGATFNLNGSLVQNGVGVFDVPRNVVAAWTNTAVITIRGYDEYGVKLTENSASGTSHTGKKAFKQIVSITSNAAITGATAGSGNVLGLPVPLTSIAQFSGELENGIQIQLPPRIYLTGQINSTDLPANTAQQLVCPVPGYVASIRAITQATITTAGTLAVQVNTVAVTGMTTPTIGTAVGSRVVATPTTARSATTVVNAGDRLTVVPAGFATAGAVNYEVEIETLRTQGTAVVMDQSANSATSGDVRGTFAPVDVPNGSIGYELMISSPEANMQAPAQYTDW